MLSIDAWLVEYLAARSGSAPSAIDRDDRFKTLGLSSLETTAMIVELGRVLGRPLAPTLAWEYPTPRALAKHLESTTAEAAATATAAARTIEPIAIVGLACRFPGAPDPEAFWSLLCGGVDAITEVPRDRWDLAELYDADPAAPGTMSTRWGGFLPHVDRFDPTFFGIAPREALQIDPQQRLALELAWEGLEDAGIVPATLRDSRAGVFFGAMWMDYARQLDGARDGIAQHTATGQDLSIVSARVSYTLGAMGPSLTVNTACSSSLVAVHLACQSLLAGESTVAIAGGVNLLIAPESTVAMTKFGAMSPDGRCKAFDARANGYVRGEGGGVVVLKRLSDARRDGDRVYCVIRGSAVNNDGFSNGLTAPSPKAQRAVIADALARAGVDPTEVQYVEAHGTGTMLGDPIEVGSLGAVYGVGRGDDRALRVGSVKTNIGHLEAAAGMAGIIKVALAMAHRTLPPSLHFQRPNPHIAFEALHVRVQTALEPWPGQRLLAGISSFGFGGTNSHAILETEVAEEPRLFVLSAATDATLRARASEVSAALLASSESLASACAAAVRAPRDRHRVAMVVTSREELARRLSAFAELQDQRGVHAGSGERPRIAMLFTGQGSQYIGMARGLYRAQPAFRAALDRVVAKLDRLLERSLLDVMWEGGELLDRTAFTQPALFAIEIAVAEMWRALGVEPDVVIGHSVGEIAAACVAGVLGIDDAAALVVARGRLMDALPAGGAMVAVAAAEASVAPRIAPDADRVAIAGVNGPANVVISGAEDAVMAIAAAFEVEGVKTRRLAVSHAFHSPLMAPMRDAFRAAISAIRPRAPRIAMVTCLDGHPVDGPLGVDHWVRHVGEPVRYLRGLEAVTADVFLEVGPHPILADLARDRGTAIATLERGGDDAATVLDAIARLVACGAPVRLGEAAEPRLVVVSGRTAAAASEQAARIAAHVAAHCEHALADVAHTLATSRGELEHRIAVVARDRDELCASLAAAPASAIRRGRGTLAFVFSGQGSQVAGMGRELAAAWPVFRDAFDDVLARFAPELRDVMWSGEGLDRTGYTQPALFAYEYALAALWRSWGVEPDVVVGHSIGEIVAACIAGVMSLDDACMLVAARARLMEACPGRGAMASIAASEDVVAEVIAGTRVEIAAVNADDQVAIAGPEGAVAAVCESFATRGVRTRSLAVSHAFHSAQMDGMLAELAAVASQLAFRAPARAMASNVSGGLAGAEVATPAYWVEHVRRTVRFADNIRASAARTFIEIGPRPVLTAAIAGLLPEAIAIGARSPLHALGEYWTAGGEVAWHGVFVDGGRRIDLPSYPWQRDRYWIDRAAPRAGVATDHPLLGQRLAVAGHTATFETILATARMPWLADHRVAGRVVVPAAAIAELVRAAGERAIGGSAEVRGLVLQAPLVLDPGDTRVQVVVDRDAVAVHSQVGDGWLLHATASIAPASGATRDAADLAGARDELDVAAIYDAFAHIGLDYGPRFRALARVWRGDREVIAELTPIEPDGFGISPVAVDAAIQAAIVARGTGELALPFEIGELAVWGGAPRAVRVQLAGDTADVVFIDASGQACARLSGLRLRRSARDRIDGLYRLDWRIVAPPARGEVASRIVVGDPIAELPYPRVGASELAGATASELVTLLARRDGETVLAAAHRIATESLGLVHAALRRGSPTKLRWVVRAGDVAAATAWGLGRTVMHEHPELELRLVDVDRLDDLARELESSDDETEVRWRDGQRQVARLVRAGAGPARALDRVARGSVVVTGGLGALGLHVARWFAERGVAHLVLTGRRGLATPGAEAAVAELSARTRVTVAAIDVAERDAVAAMLAAIPEDAPLAGIVHAAGVLDDALVEDLDAARLARVLAPKLDAAWHLHELTADRELDVFALFSSVSGLLGAAGQGNYAAANAALDALAAHRRGLGLVATSLAWGPWADAGMAARMTGAQQARLARQGQLAWAAGDAIANFAAAIERDDAELGVLHLDLAAAAHAFGDAVPPVWRELVRAPRRAETAAVRIDDVRALVTSEVARVLSLRGEVPANQPLSELGLDSLMAIELRNGLARRVGRALPATLAFDYPTVEALVGYLGAQTAPAAPAVRAAPTHEDDPIAIVGMGCRYPGGIVDGDSYWRVLAGGVDAVAEMPARWDVDALYDPDPEAIGKMTTRRGGFVAGIDQFDAGFFGIAPREAAMMDPQQRLLLETSWEALEHAGIVPDKLAGSDTGVYVGLMYQEYGALAGPTLDALDGYVTTGSAGSVASGRLSYVLGLKGPSLTVDTACSSSLVTLHLACQALRRGECSVALAGGVALMLTPSVFVEFSRLRGLAADGRCKSFGAGADGVGWAEGCGMLVLKRLRDAERDGDRILAVVRGTAVNQDGRSNGLTAPNGPSQQAVIERALADAGVRAADVDYVECHGTGTKLGDPIEAQALGAVMTGRAAPLVIGSVKSNLGHTQAAAGAAGVMKVILALAHEEIPRSLHAAERSAHVAWDELPIEVAATARAWKRGARPRLAGVSSFGISGTNAHAVLEEPPVRATPAAAERDAHLIVISAKTEAALAAQCARLAAAEHALPDLAHSLATTRTAFEHRAAFVARTADELRAALALPDGGARGMSSRSSKIVFVCPGQGSQWFGMGRVLAGEDSAFRAAFAACDRAIAAEAGWSPLGELAADATASQLDRIDVVQPMLFAYAVALAAQWRAWGVEPDAVVGHSMGEVAAAHIAGALSLEDAVAIICRRSALLRRISGRGEMAVVELSLDDAARALRGRDDRLSVAVSNSPRSTVLSGDPVALAEVLSELEARAVFCRRVKVDVASHSPQVDELRGDLLAALEHLSLRATAIEMFSTVRGRAIEGGELDAAYWVDNLREPVRFATAIDAMLGSGRGTFVELSPHPILTNAVEENRRVRPAAGITVGSSRRDRDDRACLLEAAGALWANGHAVTLAAAIPPANRVPLPSYAWQHERYWVEEAAPARVHVGHPLLGARRDVSTQPGTSLWETTLELSRLGWLRDHRVQGAVVVPGAAFVEMAATCAAELLDGEVVELRDVVLDDALALTADVAIQTAVTSDRRFQVASQGSASWRVHARGRLHAGAADPRVLPLAELRARLGAPATAEVTYRAFAALGLDYGPAFRGIAESWRTGGEALARVALPGPAGATTAYRIHPALLDACMQVALAAAIDDGGGEPWVPVAIDRIAFRGRAGTHAWCHAISAGGTADRRRVDLVIADDAGGIIAELSGLTLQQLAATTRRDADDDRFIEIDWQPAAVPEPAAPAGRWWILGADRTGDELARALEAIGHRAVRTIDLAGEPPTGVVHLGALDISPGDELDAVLAAGCDSIIATVQAIARQGWRDAPRLWLVTRGARGEAPLQATITGLGRVIALEHAELRCARIDLDPAASDGDVAHLVAELLGDDAEDEISIRASERRVARLVRRAPEDSGAEHVEPAAGRPYRLALDRPGVLDRLALRVAERRPPGPGEVEIATAAAGLNFLDVLLALGVMPNDIAGGDELRLGSECAGRVVAVGEGVTDLAVGQAVVAVTPRGAFASHVTMPATLVLPLPGGLSLAEGAALPVAYLTAWYALDRVARLSRGERVLIHAATGGVGIAAVHWAKHVGAEIYATAGTPEKRAYLASLGIDHISDSRSSQFVDDIRAWTDGEGVDVVLNSLSGDLLGASFGLLRSHGRFIELGKRDYYADHQLGLRPFLRNLSFSLVDLRGMMIERPARVRELFRELLDLVGRGVLPPPPIATRPVAEIGEAFHAMSRGQHIGKLVMTFDRDPGVVVPARSPAIRGDGAYLVTGGLGGLGLGIAAWFAEQGAGHVVLVGRGGIATDAQRLAIDAIRTRGTRVTIARGDVANRDDVARIVAEHRAELRGIVHAAGLLDDALVLQQTPAKFRAVMAPKLAGALHLHELTRELPLDLFVLYSSSAGVLGSPGQANYAAANTFLDALAHHRRALGLPALAIDWGAFAEVGLAAAQDNRAARLEARGMQSLLPDDGPRAVARLLANDRVQVAVVPLDARQWIEFYPAAAASRMLAPLVGTKRANAIDRELHARLGAAAPAERVAILHEVVAAQVARVLRLSAQALGADTPLTELGMDSLTGLELRNRIEVALGIGVPATLLWIYPTVSALARHFADAIFGTPEPAPVAATTVEAPPADDASLLSFIDDLVDRANRTEAT